MERVTSEFEGLDPSLLKLDEVDQNGVANILKNLARIFPGQALGHEISEISEQYFTLYLAGFPELEVAKLRRLVTTQRSTFRCYKIVADINSSSVGVALTFYRGKSKGQKPLDHECKTRGICFQDIDKNLLNSSLSPDEKRTTKDLAQQFCFVERYSSGNIMATIQDCGEHFDIIFSNVKEISSGFVASYLKHFETLDPGILIEAEPFEVIVRVTRKVSEQDANASKKRGRDKDQEIGNKKQK
jgi:hypothetical protein